MSSGDVATEVLTHYHLALEATGRHASASEASFYPALQELIRGIAAASGRPGVEAVLLPRLGGALCPDLQVVAGLERVIGYVEAKPPGTSLLWAKETDQLKAYKTAFPNLLLTDFREFLLFREGTQVHQAGAGDDLAPLIESFLDCAARPAGSAPALAATLAHRTRHLKDMIEGLLRRELASEEVRGERDGDSRLRDLAGFYRAFREHLIAGLEVSEFADLYAQTLTFGLFAARTRSDRDFTLETAATAVPETIGVLRDAFRYISLAHPPGDVRWVLQDIVEILRHTDVDRIFRRYFHEGRGSDPIVHFYETFLREYDSEERSRRGVFYTPLPLVSYVVGSVHRLLQELLGYRLGLADRRVRLLDPAAGTLPFLTEAWHTARRGFEGEFGDAGNTLRDHLLEHFYGLELMMAPYAVGHLKVGYLLREWGVPLTGEERCNLLLTNSLEGQTLVQTDLPGMASLSRESERAERVKKDLPVNVVVGNPPYSGHSANRDGWIDELIREGYERADGTRDDGYHRVAGKPLGERNPKWLRDDYVKFLRLAQWKIDQAGEGVVGLVTNHGYLDNPTFRGLRESLLGSFDRLYLLDLHGNLGKGESDGGGRPDENVFDIRQGVAVALLVKKPGLSRGVFRADLRGSRREKLDWLSRHDVFGTGWTEIHPRGPSFLFAPLDRDLEARYRSFLPLPRIFPVRSVGVVTARDALAVDTSKRRLLQRIDLFRQSPGTPFEALEEHLKLKSTRTWNMDEARAALRRELSPGTLATRILFRPFDVRWIFYSDYLVERPRRAVMEHMLRLENLGLVVPKQGRGGGGALVTRHIVGHKSVSAFDINSLFPLYLAAGGAEHGPLFAGAASEAARAERVPNLDGGLQALLARACGAPPPSPEAVLAYVYAVLWAPPYREAYAPLLELDFPRVPFPRNGEVFRAMAALGARLVDLHLLRAPDLLPPTVRLEGPAGPVDIDKRPPAAPPALSRRPVDYRAAEKRIVVGREGLSFSGVPREVWELEIGGHQVLRRWLRDRAGDPLSSEDVETFCRTATALARTLEVQEELARLYPAVEEDPLRIGEP